MHMDSFLSYLVNHRFIIQIFSYVPFLLYFTSATLKIILNNMQQKSGFLERGIFAGNLWLVTCLV